MDLKNIRHKSLVIPFSNHYKTVSETYPEPSQTSKMELFVKNF